jgi:23S rRNA pseudouridine2604 synthase
MHVLNAPGVVEWSSTRDHVDMRLNKFISESGRCSRREADEWLADGRVTVNGRIAGLGDVVETDDEVRVDGDLVRSRQSAGAKSRVYIALYKPRGITCTTESDVENNIVDFVDYPERIFPIGRLDKDSEGLILLTNDGDIVNRLLRVENRHEKEYVVTVNRAITPEFVARMSRGVDIGEQVTRPCKVQRLSKFTFRIVLTQGLNRQIRRMCEAQGMWVRSLVRVRIVNLRLGHLKPGQWRKLTPEEVAGLVPAREPAGSHDTPPAPAPRPRKPRQGVADPMVAPAAPKRRTRPGAVRSSSMRPDSPWRPGRAPAARSAPSRDARERPRGASPARGKPSARAPVAAKSAPRPARRPVRPGPRSR